MTRDELAGLQRLRDLCPPGLQSDGLGTVTDLSGAIVASLDPISEKATANEIAFMDLASLAPGVIDKLAAFHSITEAVGVAWHEQQDGDGCRDGMMLLDDKLGELAFHLVAGGGLYAEGRQI